jgi:hypothetical protein
MKIIKLIILILAVILSIIFIYKIIFSLSDYFDCSKTCGNYTNEFNTSGCFCRDNQTNMTVKSMYR